MGTNLSALSSSPEICTMIPHLLRKIQGYSSAVAEYLTYLFLYFLLYLRTNWATSNFRLHPW
jgi:hypothetical protein